MGALWTDEQVNDHDVKPVEGEFLMPNVRAKREPAAGRQRPDGENVPRTTGRALVACRWRSA